MMKHLSGLLLVLALSSCTTTAPALPESSVLVPLQTVFDPSEVAFINELGSNTIKGSAFMRQQGGGEVGCAGNAVYLIPQGASSIERAGRANASMFVFDKTSSSGYGSAIANRKMPAPPGDAYRSHQRETICDIDGKFEFQNVAAGSYLVVTRVTWTVDYSTQGGTWMVPVTFAGSNKTKSVVVNTLLPPKRS